MTVFEERLKLAAEKAALADEAKNEVEKQFKAYKAEIAANGDKATLAAMQTRVDLALRKLEGANNDVVAVLGGTGDLLADVSIVRGERAEQSAPTRNLRRLDGRAITPGHPICVPHISDRTPLGRMLPSVIGGPAGDRGIRLLHRARLGSIGLVMVKASRPCTVSWPPFTICGI